MPISMDRRALLQGLSALGLSATAFPASAQSSLDALKLGAPSAFSFELLKAEMKALASKPYSAPELVAADILEQIDYEAHGKISYRPDHALFANGPGQYPVTFFHLGKFFKKPVDMHLVHREQGKLVERPILYDPSYFNMPDDSPAKKLPPNVGFAGFRYQEPRSGKLDWKRNDWVAFLGASYFRAIGELYQYGLSARGIALNSAIGGVAEEFPDFTKFYIEAPEADGPVTLYARLEGPSITGAFRFVMARGKAVIMDIDAEVHLRADVQRFGIAPLTSMYWFSDTAKQTATDWRPEVHDSDGLALLTGSGKHIWRPLNNPPHVVASSFSDQSPKGFGLAQRDRNFDHYQDGVRYDRRPTLWVEPKGDWGAGAVQLLELPTDDEIHDNIVAMWVPEKPAKAGDSFKFAYRLHWVADEPFSAKLGRVVATRLGNGGQPGQPRPKGVRKFLIEFLGGPLESLAAGEIPTAVISTSRGEIGTYKQTEAVPDDVPGHWRTQFDLKVEGPDPVELTLHLKSGEKVLTEVWAYQYHPFGNTL